jgi:hypothetical protein
MMGQSLANALIRVAQEVMSRVVGLGPIPPASTGAKN